MLCIVVVVTYVLDNLFLIDSLFQVLFTLLEHVQTLSTTASTDKDDKRPANILIHHSRDTAAKQWAETRVLTLAGVARVFNMKRHILQHLGNHCYTEKNFNPGYISRLSYYTLIWRSSV